MPDVRGFIQSYFKHRKNVKSSQRILYPWYGQRAGSVAPALAT